MPEIQEQIHDYRLAQELPSHHSPCTSASCPWLLPSGTCTYLLLYVCLVLSGYPSVEYLCIFLSFPVFIWLRTKRTLGLGSLYGENDLLDLDGDPLRERQVAEKQLAALGDIL